MRCGKSEKGKSKIKRQKSKMKSARPSGLAVRPGPIFDFCLLIFDF
jgi:hypothetical protein